MPALDVRTLALDARTLALDARTPALDAGNLNYKKLSEKSSLRLSNSFFVVKKFH